MLYENFVTVLEIFLSSFFQTVFWSEVDFMHLNKCYKLSRVNCVRDVCEVLFGLLVSVFEGVVGQRGFVARVLHHVVPCDQSLANGCSPWLKTLLGRKKAKGLMKREQVTV